MKLSVSGFGAFPGVTLNISEALVDAWRRVPPSWGVEVKCEVFPTSYAAAGMRAASIVTEHMPRLLLMLGVAPMAGTLRFERFALNIDDARSADVDGVTRRGTSIADDGPLALATSLDLARLHDAALAHGLDATVSNHAGTYVCNHAYYSALLAASRVAHPVDVLFIHLPNAVEADEAMRRQVLLQCQGAVDAVARHLIDTLRRGD